jgi:hypothetical protein
MTSLVATDADGTVKKYMLEKFQFKLDEEKNALVFVRTVSLRTL